MKILIIEDEPSLREVMQRALTEERYVVETASTYFEADAKLAGYSYDCILLDIMLPDGNGLRLLEHIKKQNKRDNVIIISARDSLEDKVFGLEQGADDYLPKPFHTAELKARIKSVLRRGKSGGNLTLTAGNVSLEPESSRVTVEGKELLLLKKEFDILLYFMQRPNHLVDKSILAEAVWGDHADQADNFHFVYAQMKNLRRKLTEAKASIEIKAIYGFGYKLILPETE
ncbi:MAG TPA: response regulator transcription factor [Candidatus Avirikenella pullistercoris]|nr:response regulator transcription factor [Candidatus Avirikenella pullistercoris]